MDETDEETTDFDKILEMKASRNQLDEAAEKRRQQRDELNSEAKKWARERDKFNAQVRELVIQARAHKARRDELNSQVQEAKEKRTVLNQQAMEKRLAVAEVKRRKVAGGRSGPPVHKLKKDLQELEFKQMTSQLTTEEERELVKKLGEIQDSIKNRDSQLKADPDIAAALEAAAEAKQAAQEQHKQIREMVAEAQAAHKEMTTLYRQIDVLRKEADGYQEKFVMAKKAADEAHHSYIDMVKQIHDLDKLIQSKRRSFSSVTGKSRAKTKADAEDLFARLMTGEKLSTDEIMTIQKAGLL